MSLSLVQKANEIDDPLESITEFHKLVLGDDSIIELSCKRVTKLTSEKIKWIFDLMNRNMKTLYQKSSWGWDAVKKQTELLEKCAYYLIATCNDKPIGFSHFRFDMDYGFEVLYWYVIMSLHNPIGIAERHMTIYIYILHI